MKKLFLFLIASLFLISLANAQTWNSSFEEKLQIHYNFNTWTGNNFSNEINISQWNGTGLGGASYTDNGFSLGGLLLDGSNDYCSLDSQVSDINTIDIKWDNFTLCAWVNITPGQYGAILGGTGNNFNFGINSSICSGTGNHDNFCIHSWDGTHRTVLSTTLISDMYDQWVFVCAARENVTNQATLYINGTAENTGQISFVTASDNPLYIARDGNNNYFGGVMDDFYYWNRYLSSGEISQLYNSGLGLRPNQPSLLTVTLNSPIDDNIIAETTITFNSSFSFTSLNLTNASLYIWNSSGDIFNLTTNIVTGTSSNQTTWNVTGFVPNDYDWNVYACATNSSSTLCSFAESNYSFEFGLIVNSNNYENRTTDVTNTSISINVTTISGIEFDSASLIYNGTVYSATSTTSGNDKIFSTIIDTPLVHTPTNFTFFWSITLSNGGFSTINTSVQTQEVIPSNFTLCSAAYPVKAVNYSIYDESTLSLISGVNFESTFNWNLGGSGTKNISYDLTSSSFSFCIHPNSTFYVDSDIFLSANGYESRNYRLPSEVYTNISQNMSLYLLNQSESRDVIIVLKDFGLRPLEDYTIKIYRRLQSTNDLILVENDVTDVFGQIVTSLVENDVKYKLEFYNESSSLVKTVNNAIVACRSTICLQEFIIEDTSDPFSPFNDIDDYTSSLTFNNNTNIFSYVWVDNTGVSSVHRLEVIRQLFNGTSVVCNTTSSSSSGVLSCSVGSSRATYFSSGYRSASPEMRRQLLNVRVGSLYNRFGLEGFFWNMVLLMTLVLAGLYYPPIGIVLYLFGTILLGVFDIIYINPAIIFAEIVIGGLFIWWFRG